MRWMHLPKVGHRGMRAIAGATTVALLQVCSLVASLDASALTGQTISFAALSGKTFGAAPFTISGTASSGLAVSFTSLATPVCTIGVATVTILAAGTCTIQASQAGNATYAAAPTVNRSFAVAKAAQTITFAALAGKTYGAAPFVVSATASSGLPVIFVSTTTAVCTASGATVTIAAGGTCTIQSQQLGSTNYNAAANVNQSFTVAKAAQTITFAALAGKTYGNAPFTVSATASSGLAMTFTSTTTTVCTVSGSTVTIRTGGTCTVQAAQAGNINYNAAASVSRSFTVVKANQTITFAAPANKTYGAAPFTVSATASSSLAVTLSSLTTPVCSVSGSTVTLVAAGTCTIQAAQAGNGNYNPAPNLSQSLSIAQATQTVTFPSPGNKLINASPISLSATASSGLTVSFSSLSPAVCSANGSTATLVAAGTCAIQGTQPGNGSYLAAPSVTQSFTVMAVPQFSAALIYATDAFPSAITAEDFSGDGKSDLAVANSFSANVSILLGNGDGTFVSGAPVQSGGTTDAVAVGDFNGDGKLDLAIGDISGNAITIYSGNGNGTFTLRSTVNVSTPASIAVADLNGDGKADLVVANGTYGSTTGQTAAVVLGNGDGSFRAPVSYTTGPSPYGVVVGDFNWDGKPDLAVVNGDNNSVSILLGLGNGTFTAAANYATGWYPDAIAIGDFNADGKLDLAVGNDFSNDVSILLGNGNGTFGSATSFPAGSGPASVAVADFNGDGWADLAICNRFDNSVVVLIGNGDGTFQSALTFVVGGNPNALISKDVNRDGKPDLVTVNAYDNTVSIFTNTSIFVAVGSISIQAGSPQVATVSTAFMTPFSVIVRDPGNSPLAGAVVTFTAPTVGQGGTFAGGSPVAQVVTAASGVATAPAFTANATTGAYSVIASVGASSAILALNNAAISQPPAFTSGAQPNGAVNAPYSFLVTATGSPAPTFSVATGALPPGLTLDNVFGVINGTPNTAGTFAGSFKATNGVVPDATQGFTIVIARSAQTIAFGSFANQPLGSGPITITVTATASSGLPVSLVSLYELGLQWRHTYDRTATPAAVAAAGAIATVSRPDGKRFIFERLGATWTPDNDVADQLLPVVDGNNNLAGWRYLTTTDDTEIYDAAGELRSITARNGMTQTLVYSDSTTPGVPKAGLLIQVTDSLGRSLVFAYDAQARIIKVIDQAGQPYLYGYDQAGNLATVTYPGLVQRQYLYNEMAHVQNANAPWLLTGIVDENGERFATFSYDAKGRAIATEHARGIDRYQFSYIGKWPAVTTVVTDPLGTQRTYDYSSLNSHYTNTALSQPCIACGGNSGRSITYDKNSNATAITDFNGIRTTFAFDLTRNLETSRTEASGTTQQRTVTTQWHPTYRLPTQITEPAPGGTRTTTFTYDSSGNMLTKSILAPKNDGTGSTTTRSWSWTYGSFGRTLTATDPNLKTTIFAYNSDSDPNTGKRGNLASITNPAGHVTLISGYDLAGRPTITTDANGLTTTLNYDARGRMTSRQVGIETTRYAYDGAGQLIKVTLPDASSLQYTYDDAHRLIQVDDTLGHSIVYTLDAIGNRIQEQVFNSSDNLTRSRSRTFNSLNQLASDLGAQAQRTSYTYDNNNNLATVTDPLGHSNGNIYDALNRLTAVLDPNLGTVRYSYDAADNLGQVTDQRALVTSYTYDGLNNPIKVQSPDTGQTVSTYDLVGNLLTKLDSRGVAATYSYDNINRTTKIVFHRSSTDETHQFRYDVGVNGKGHLTQITDSAAVTTWTYNTQGRVASKAQAVDAFTKIVAYGYNNAGQLVAMTTPSGQQIGYTYINNRVSGITVNGQTLLHGAVTMPFGPLSSWLWGNGLFTFRDYDRDGRVASWEFRNGVSILRKEQTFDAASRIIAINDPNQIGASQAYQYDPLDRITVAQIGTPPTHTQQFAYDSVGNRLNITIDNSVTNAAYGTSNNQLQTLSGSLPASYLLGSGTQTFTYNNANRLSAALNGSTTIATYRVNAQGQRVSKSVGGAITYFVYDEPGHVLGEYDRTGSLIEETIWFEDLPVATLRPTGAGGIPTPINVYYVHADHLGSSRAVTRPSDNKLMWQWDNLDPFGANPANENPAGQGTFTYNLRFPGQHYDAEIGTYYNYFRDYDPALGRYLESDPIGLDGGVNTFAYALNTPVKRKDFFGLDSCGSGFNEGLVPDNPFGFPFSHCCNRHDNCYDNCFSKPSQSECDETFCQCMLNRCGRYSGSLLRVCTDVANGYCWAVKRGGANAFADARKKCCR